MLCSGLGEPPHLDQRANQWRWELLADWSSGAEGSSRTVSVRHSGKKWDTGTVMGRHTRARVYYRALGHFVHFVHEVHLLWVLSCLVVRSSRIEYTRSTRYGCTRNWEKNEVDRRWSLRALSGRHLEGYVAEEEELFWQLIHNEVARLFWQV